MSFQEALSGKMIICCTVTVLYSTCNTVGWFIASISDLCGIDHFRIAQLFRVDYSPLAKKKVRQVYEVCGT